MNEYRTHLCSELTIDDLNKEVVLSGWIDTIRDHGNLLFIDLRDNYGITQCVVDSKKIFFDEISKLTNESVVKINGQSSQAVINVPEKNDIYLYAEVTDPELCSSINAPCNFNKLTFNENIMKWPNSVSPFQVAIISSLQKNDK